MLGMSFILSSTFWSSHHSPLAIFSLIVPALHLCPQIHFWLFPIPTLGIRGADTCRLSFQGFWAGWLPAQFSQLEAVVEMRGGRKGKARVLPPFSFCLAEASSSLVLATTRDPPEVLPSGSHGAVTTASLHFASMQGATNFLLRFRSTLPLGPPPNFSTLKFRTI